MSEREQCFSDRLLEAIDSKKSVIVVGLDPQYLLIPLTFRAGPLKVYGNSLKAASESIVSFNKCIIDSVEPFVPAVKPQVAFYEMYGEEGIRAFSETVRYAKQKGLIVVEDAKRNDIGSTAQAYSDGHIGKTTIANGFQQSAFDVDAITINPYLGSDGVKPFLVNVERYGKGVFVLVKTSNPSSNEIQDLALKEHNVRIFEYVAQLVNEWGKMIIGSRGYSSVGAVVGATYPEHARVLREIMPRSIFLVPGYGVQGATGKDIISCFNLDGYGALIAASRSINYPKGYDLNMSEESFKGLVRFAIKDMNSDINGSLRQEKLLPW